MSLPPPREGEVLACPHCDEPTMANRMADGSLVCSCAAERQLPEAAARPRLVPAPGQTTSESE